MLAITVVELNGFISLPVVNFHIHPGGVLNFLGRAINRMHWFGTIPFLEVEVHLQPAVK